MATNLRGKIALILAVIFISAYYTYANIKWHGLGEEDWRDRALNLGLDLQGGMHLVLDVDTEKAFQAQISREAKDLERYLGGRIGGATVTLNGDKVYLELAEPGDYEEAREILRDRYRQWEVERKSDTKLLLIYDSSQARRIKRSAREQALEVIRSRVDEFGVAEPSIQPQGERRIIIQLPGMKDPERAKRLIGRTALLEFKLVNPDRRELERALEGRVPAGYELKYLEVIDARGEVTYEPLLLRTTPELTGADLIDAFSTFGERVGEMIVQLRFNRRGGRIMSRISGEAARKWERERIATRLAILLDGTVVSAPQMRVRVGDSPIIEGDFTAEEAKDLALVLRAGALPAPISIVEERTVGASLGEDSIRAGVRAAILGLIAVAFFVAIYYLKVGLITNFALALDLAIILAVLSVFGATLTLPGIAGLILTIGIAVDANVLIFERIREELKVRKTVRSAISSGYQKAFRTILDANVTTLIAAAVLFQFGTGPIRGFAVTLGIGILASMFTALVVTRVILELLYQRHPFTTLKMMQFISSVPHIHFAEKRKLAFVLSGLVILVGMVSFVQRGEDKYGIDFTGGTLVQRSFREVVPVEKIRGAIAEVGLETRIQQIDGGRGVIIRTELGEDYVHMAHLVDDKLKAALGGVFIDDPRVNRTEMVGPVVGRELRRSAIWALSIALILIVIYVAWRFEFKFGIAAILALLHDVLITAGLFALTGREFSLPVIAALLTVIGYSLNDTIVVFDRIRENLKPMRKERYETIIDTSINQTLSRTLLTSLTTFLVVLSLFLLGGEIIRDFAFALMVGIVVGTYSSIFIASPVLVEWQARFKRRGTK